MSAAATRSLLDSIGAPINLSMTGLANFRRHTVLYGAASVASHGPLAVADRAAILSEIIGHPAQTPFISTITPSLELLQEE